MTLQEIRKNRLTVTRAVADAMKDLQTAAYIFGCLNDCFRGDYGEMPPEDAEANNRELKAGEGRIVARYEARGTMEQDIYIICYFSEQEPGADCNFTEMIYVNEY